MMITQKAFTQEIQRQAKIISLQAPVIGVSGPPPCRKNHPWGYFYLQSIKLWYGSIVRTGGEWAEAAIGDRPRHLVDNSLSSANQCLARIRGEKGSLHYVSLWTPKRTPQEFSLPQCFRTSHQHDCMIRCIWTHRNRAIQATHRMRTRMTFREAIQHWFGRRSACIACGVVVVAST